MFNYILGKLKEISDNKIVVENNGLAFDIFFPISNITNLPEIDNEVKIYTYMNVKEDEMSLYGFLTKEDKEMFLKLLTVNGVGPKGALNIISTFGFSTIIKAIRSNDSKLISSVSGIGKKTAEKICIELIDKVNKLEFNPNIAKDIIKENNEVKNKISDLRDEVTAALVKLGYKESKARELIAKVDIDESMTASDILKLTLK